jgi:hypothetical protein
MVSGVADGVWTAAGIVVDAGVANEADDTQRATGQIDAGVSCAVDEAEGGLAGAVSTPPAPRTAMANASDAPTRANASDALRIVRRAPGGASER